MLRLRHNVRSNMRHGLEREMRVALASIGLARVGGRLAQELGDVLAEPHGDHLLEHARIERRLLQALAIARALVALLLLLWLRALCARWSRSRRGACSRACTGLLSVPLIALGVLRHFGEELLGHRQASFRVFSRYRIIGPLLLLLLLFEEMGLLCGSCAEKTRCCVEQRRCAGLGGRRRIQSSRDRDP